MVVCDRMREVCVRRHVGLYSLMLNLKVEMAKEPVSEEGLVGIAC